MRLPRRTTATLLSAMTAGLLALSPYARADGVTVRMDAIETAPIRIAQAAGFRPRPLWVMPDRARPAQIAFSTGFTPWQESAEPLLDGPIGDGTLQCVPFARSLSGIGIYGDAWTWWDKAAGTFARGNLPEPGSVLSFPSIERMPLGHVAVVTKVLSPRTILIDHANWPNAIVQHGAISRDILVADVSPANDWREVRVQFGKGGPLGSVYPANGFIYGWSETGEQVAHPRLPLDGASGPPALHAFGALAYMWVLPASARQKTYAALGLSGRLPGPVQYRRPLILAPLGTGLAAGTFGHPLGVSALGTGPGGRMVFGLNRF